MRNGRIPLVFVVALGALGLVVGSGRAGLAASDSSAACPQGTTATKTTYQVPVTTPDDTGRPVSLSADVYVPSGAAAPPTGFPLLEIFHGGGSTKDNGYDAGHAAFFAENCFVVLLYSQRGNGSSSGQEAVAGPKEIRDLFDMTAWLTGDCGSDTTGECALAGLPSPPAVPIDPGRIALSGYSQGGLNTNLGEAWSTDSSVDPYGFAISAIEPGNTPDYVFDALVPNGVVKLSVGAGLVETYATGPKQNIDPLLAKWITTAAADEPAAYGDLSTPCDVSRHDTATSTMVQDLAWRSVACRSQYMTAPVLWAQSFDDVVFPPDMAVHMFGSGVHGQPGLAATTRRLYLTMGGHAAPAAPQAAEADKLDEQLQFLDAVFGIGTATLPPAVVFWTRDPHVAVDASTYRYPDGSWYRQTASSWPPPDAVVTSYELGADGLAYASGTAPTGIAPLAPFAEDEAHDPVAAAATSATPLGTSPVPTALPATSSPDLVASFATPAFSADLELAGAPEAMFGWVPAGPDSQLVLEVFDQAPDGTLTLLSRGVTGIRGAVPGQLHAVTVAGNTFSALVRAGDRVVTWVMDGDVAFYKPYVGGAGGLLRLGPTATLSLPLRPAASGH
ncbi:MAG: CocE/NonD family hydrolase [Acidimicrobiales bacterium]